MNWTEITSRGVAAAEIGASNFMAKPLGRTALNKFARQLGVNRIELQDMDGDALLIERPDGGHTLFLNSKQTKVRHRFSVAHEISHLLLNRFMGQKTLHRRKHTPDQDSESRKLEFLCDSMASAILMPYQAISGLINDANGESICVPEIAKIFGVSFEASARRFAKAVNRPCALLIWREDELKDDIVSGRPILNRPYGKCWAQMSASKQKGEWREVVRSQESLVLNIHMGTKTHTISRFENVDVETQVNGRGKYRKMYSFIYLQ